MSEDAAATRKRWVPVSASAMGTVIEWYDFFLYSSAAVLVFNTQFFGDVSPVVGTMIAFATYAIGFVVRPSAASSSATSATASGASRCCSPPC
ncbi:hypothetical protein ACU61A_24375 [Pseudonocardia sichuanensis]